MAGLARRTRWKRSPPVGTSRVWDLNDVLIRSPQLFYFLRKLTLSALLSGCCVGWELWGPPGVQGRVWQPGPIALPQPGAGQLGALGTRRDVSLGTGWVGDRLGYRPMGWPGSAVSMAGQGWAVGSWSLALLGPCWGRGCQPWSDVGSGAGGRASLGISRDSVAWQCPQAPHTFTPPHSPSKLLSYFPPSCCLSWLLTCRG